MSFNHELYKFVLFEHQIVNEEKNVISGKFEGNGITS